MAISLGKYTQHFQLPTHINMEHSQQIFGGKNPGGHTTFRCEARNDFDVDTYAVYWGKAYFFSLDETTTRWCPTSVAKLIYSSNKLGL